VPHKQGCAAVECDNAVCADIRTGSFPAQEIAGCRKWSASCPVVVFRDWCERQTTTTHTIHKTATTAGVVWTTTHRIHKQQQQQEWFERQTTITHDTQNSNKWCERQTTTTHRIHKTTTAEAVATISPAPWRSLTGQSPSTERFLSCWSVNTCREERWRGEERERVCVCGGVWVRVCAQRARTVFVDKHVFGLQIAIDHVAGMQIVQRQHQLRLSKEPARQTHTHKHTHTHQRLRHTHTHTHTVQQTPHHPKTYPIPLRTTNTAQHIHHTTPHTSHQTKCTCILDKKTLTA
jgi:hypothetical protein